MGMVPPTKIDSSMRTRAEEKATPWAFAGMETENFSLNEDEDGEPFLDEKPHVVIRRTISFLNVCWVPASKPMGLAISFIMNYHYHANFSAFDFSTLPETPHRPWRCPPLHCHVILSYCFWCLHHLHHPSAGGCSTRLHDILLSLLPCLLIVTLVTS